MEIYTYYNLSECNNRKAFLDELNILQNDGKIEYTSETSDVIKIEDIGLDDHDTSKLIHTIDNYEVIPDLDYTSSDWDEEDGDWDDDSEDSDDDWE